jgi:hypothetical protein
MGRQPGPKRRERETIDEIKTGKQQKLDLFCMPKICLVPSPLPALLPSQGAPLLESMDSGEVNVHEIVDEEDTFVNQFPCGDLTSQKLKAARSTLLTLIRLRSKKVRILHPSPKKRRNVYSMKQRELITQLFNQMTGSLTERIEKINMIHGS